MRPRPDRPSSALRRSSRWPTQCAYPCASQYVATATMVARTTGVGLGSRVFGSDDQPCGEGAVDRVARVVLRLNPLQEPARPGHVRSTLAKMSQASSDFAVMLSAMKVTSPWM